MGGQGQTLRHVAVIPDGNRRWSRARGGTATDGHAAGIANIGRHADMCFAEGVDVFSFWWGSLANLTKRSPEEVRGIVGVLGDWLKEEAPALLQRHDATLSVLGRWETVCPDLVPAVEVARAAAGTGPRRLCVLMAYDGRDEIRDAAARLAGAGATEDEFTSALWTGQLPPVDLIVRTGGSSHMSAGFLMWQGSEARVRFEAEMWPGYEPEALRRALREEERVERRYGA